MVRGRTCNLEWEDPECRYYFIRVTIIYLRKIASRNYSRIFGKLSIMVFILQAVVRFQWDDECETPNKGPGPKKRNSINISRDCVSAVAAGDWATSLSAQGPSPSEILWRAGSRAGSRKAGELKSQWGRGAIVEQSRKTVDAAWRKARHDVDFYPRVAKSSGDVRSGCGRP